MGPRHRRPAVGVRQLAPTPLFGSLTYNLLNPGLLGVPCIMDGCRPLGPSSNSSSLGTLGRTREPSQTELQLHGFWRTRMLRGLATRASAARRPVRAQRPRSQTARLRRVALGSAPAMALGVAVWALPERFPVRWRCREPEAAAMRPGQAQVRQAATDSTGQGMASHSPHNRRRELGFTWGRTTRTRLCTGTVRRKTCGGSRRQPPSASARRAR